MTPLALSVAIVVSILAALTVANLSHPIAEACCFGWLHIRLTLSIYSDSTGAMASIRLAFPPDRESWAPEDR